MYFGCAAGLWSLVYVCPDLEMVGNRWSRARCLWGPTRAWGRCAWGCAGVPTHPLWVKSAWCARERQPSPEILTVHSTQVSPWFQVCFELKKNYWFFWERETLIVPLMDALIGWFLHVPWLGIKPATLAYRQDALTIWVTLPGPRLAFKRAY